MDRGYVNVMDANRVIVMFRAVVGLSRFISIERGFMLFMITVAAMLLMEKSLGTIQALFVGLIVLFGWSAVDSMNNVCDMTLDAKSDPLRAEYARKLGPSGLVICIFLCGMSIALGVLTGMPLLDLFIMLGLVAGVLYSVPPFRLRQTVFKPFVNFSVGAIPVLIAAASSNYFSASVWSLVFVIGLTTGVNSLWEDLADYESDVGTDARTMPIVLGVRRGLYVTIITGYLLLPGMILVGVMFQLGVLYYLILFGLAAYLSIHLIRDRSVLFGKPSVNPPAMLRLGEALAKDFVVIAIIQTANLMLSAFLK